MNGKRKNLTVGWSGPYELYRLYENGSAKLKDLEGMELPDRVNIGKLKKYQTREEDQEETGREDLRKVREEDQEGTEREDLGEVREGKEQKEKSGKEDIRDAKKGKGIMAKNQPEKRVTRQSVKYAKGNVAEVSHVQTTRIRNDRSNKGTAAWKSALAIMIVLLLILAGCLVQTSKAEQVRGIKKEYKDAKVQTNFSTLLLSSIYSSMTNTINTAITLEGARCSKMQKITQTNAEENRTDHAVQFFNETFNRTEDRRNKIRRKALNNNGSTSMAEEWNKIIQQEKGEEEETKDKGKVQNRYITKHTSIIKSEAQAQNPRKNKSETAMKAARLGTGGENDRSSRREYNDKLNRRVSKLVKVKPSGVYPRQRSSFLHHLIAALRTEMMKDPEP